MAQSEAEQRFETLKQDIITYGKEILRVIDAQYVSQPSGNERIKSTHDTFDFKLDPKNSLHILRDDLTELLEDQLESKKQLKELSQQYEKDLMYCDNYISLLETICKVTDTLEQLDIYIDSVDIKKTNVTLAILKDLLASLPNDMSEYGNGYVCRSLRKEYLTCKGRYYARLRRLMDQCIVVSYGKVLIKKELIGVISDEDIILDHSVALCDIWNALLSVDNVNEIISNILVSIWQQTMKPLWRERKAPSIQTNITATSAELVIEFTSQNLDNMDSLVTDALESNPLSSKPVFADRVHSTCRLPIHMLFESLQQITSFVFNEVFCGISQLSPAISTKLASPPITLLVVLFDTVIGSLPKLENELNVFIKTIERPMREFEKKLLEFQLLSATSTVISAGNGAGKDYVAIYKKLESKSQYKGITSVTPLSSLCSALQGRYLEHQRKEIIRQAKEYLLADYHNIMYATGDANEDETSSAGNIGDKRAMLEQSGSFAMQVLQFDPCQISLASCRLLKLIHEILKQIHNYSKSANPQNQLLVKILIQCIRDCFELFLTIVPVKYYESIHEQLRLGAVFYNDCMYIAHNTTLITYHYRTTLSQEGSMAMEDTSINSTVANYHYELGYVDIIPRLRVEGERILNYHITQQIKALDEIITEIHIDPIGKTETKKTTALHHSDGANSKTTCNNEQAVTKVFHVFSVVQDSWKDVLQESVYHRVLGYLLEHVLRQLIEPLFQAECITESAAIDISRILRSVQKIKGIVAHGASDAAMTQLAASWSRFCAMADLLEYSLSDIAEWLPRRKFSSFTSHQLSSLIRALFEDTPKRQALLTSIVDISN